MSLLFSHGQTETKNSLLSIADNWPRTGSKEEALSRAIDLLNSIGLSEIPSDVSIETGNPADYTGVPYSAGVYIPDQNKIIILPELEQSIKDGVPFGWHVLLHELGHSNQEHNNEMPLVTDPDVKDFCRHLEGQNDMITLMAMSKLYKRPMDNISIAKMTNDYYSDKSTNIPRLKLVGYYDESRHWAGLAELGSRKYGISPSQFIVESHKSGFSHSEQHRILKDLFPEQMSEGNYTSQFPPMEIVSEWIANSGVEVNNAYNNLLESSVNE